MAAPESKSLQSLSGRWKLNKDLSDDFTPVLALQGVNILLRKAIGSASVQLKISQPSSDHIRMEQTATSASIPGTTEEYNLDWEWRQNHDAFFGDIEGRSRWITADQAKEFDASGEWIGGDSEGKLIQAVGKKPDDAWTATHIWGFEQVGGERRHTRRVHVVSKEGEEIDVRMVYDFVGE